MSCGNESHCEATCEENKSKGLSKLVGASPLSHWGPVQCLVCVQSTPGVQSTLLRGPGEDKEKKSSPRAVLLNLHLGAVLTQSCKEHVIIYLVAEM